MDKLINWFQKHFTNLFKAALFLGSILLIVQFFPRQTRFAYDYQQGRPWLHEDLIAPFNFAVLKSDEELEEDRAEVLRDFRPFFRHLPEIAEEQEMRFVQEFDREWQKRFGETEGQARKENLEKGFSLLDSVFSMGVISFEGAPGEVNSDYAFRLIEGHTATSRRVSDFLTMREAFLWISTQLEKEAGFERDLLLSLIENAMAANIVFDHQYSEMTREAELDKIPLSRGMVQQGEKIISRGELVTPEKFRLLESFKAEFQKQAGQTSIATVLYAGQLLLVSISIVVLALFLWFFRREVFFDNRRLVLILLSVFILVFITSQVVKAEVDWLFLLPVCIVPILIRAFFDNRLALYVHIITIIIIGFLVPRSFEFVFMQFVAGIVAIFSMVNLRRRSQLFITVMLIFLTYSAIFFGLSLAQTGTTRGIDWINFAYFGGAATLTLFAYPLIFLFERIFALPTDFSLLELADTNNTLLRELNLNAPGTFQHSLQVANLAEEAIIQIGGNSLLTRTGALYHDIGKIKNPMFFTENQASGFNPHDDIPREESARIIISHVIEGIEMARKKNIPEYIIDFIRTHHGTTTARYFFSMHKKENPGVETDIKAFTYPGPRPFSKETAVVMMADSVEAASRSMRKPDERSISDLVEKIIDTQIAEKQFENANITFKDITVVKKIFKRRLMNIYHVRIVYPSLN
ncbi:MAG: HDIG domain-containing metalloprotein [Bacteroides sp.]|jgi:putative nucleotidyltransferase with HDIG domain|nr:HDIG domain-containing metalloprotein [Bacteroides sp.]